jgi:hypothetical protein
VQGDCRLRPTSRGLSYGPLSRRANVGLSAFGTRLAALSDFTHASASVLVECHLAFAISSVGNQNGYLLWD